METKRNKRKFDSITSYGLALFWIDNNDPTNVFFLLHQRRDTFEYVDFILGTWNSDQPLSSFFMAMSNEERTRIANHSFNELWDDIWVNKDARQYRDNYKKALDRYNKVKHEIAYIINTTTSTVTEPPWGLPKGRKNLNESDLECAIRETEEETRISRHKYTVLHVEEPNQDQHWIKHSKAIKPRVSNLPNESLLNGTRAYDVFSSEEAMHYVNKPTITKNLQSFCLGGYEIGTHTTIVERDKFTHNYGNFSNKSGETTKNFCRKKPSYDTKFSERFEGSNGLYYTTIYYLTRVSDRELPEDMATPLCIRTNTYSEEAKTVKWVHYNDIGRYLNNRRILMLQEVYASIQKYSVLG